MADLDALQDFAAANFIGQTAPLSPARVRRLARHWLPEMRFYRDEHFFPVAIEQVVSQVVTEFAAMSPADRTGARIDMSVRDGDGTRIQTVDPPVLYEGASFSTVDTDGTVTLHFASRILASGDVADDLEDADVDGDTRLSHGASFGRSDRFFGPIETLEGGETDEEDRPFRPRIVPMTVIATFVNLPEALRYELLTQEADDYPPDGMRGGIDIARELLDPIAPGYELPGDLVREVVLALLEAWLSGDPAAFQEAVDDLPLAVTFNKDTWDTLTRYAFVEYDLFYPFNDFDRYQTTPFENEHEGDDEGFCLVFERNALIAAAASGSDEILLGVTPHSIITLVHEEAHDGDLHEFLPAGTNREDMDLIVWIAAGSHATYLSSGTHDLVDFQDTYTTVSDGLSFLPGIAQILGVVFGILTSFADFFIDTEDFTSDDGVHSGPQDLVGAHPTFVRAEVAVVPMSAQNHIYEQAQRLLLAHRAYAGRWGGHDGLFDVSPTFKVKTGRYFRKLLDALD